jgi:hypothetical protein
MWALVIFAAYLLIDKGIDAWITRYQIKMQMQQQTFIPAPKEEKEDEEKEDNGDVRHIGFSSYRDDDEDFDEEEEDE